MSNKLYASLVLVVYVCLFYAEIHPKNQDSHQKKVKDKIAFDYHAGDKTYKIPSNFFADIVGNTQAQLRDIVKSVEAYPATFTILASLGLGYQLYKNDIFHYVHSLKLDEFIYGKFDTQGKCIQEGHKNEVLFGLWSIIAGLYLSKNKIFEACHTCLGVEDDDEEVDETTSTSDNDNIYSFSKSSVRIYRPGEIKTKFKDVAGLETAKEELMDILMFLKDSQQFKDIGAKIPKGVLLSGSPGNGKTLLARALAGEVQCPFLYVSASEFIEAIVGVGAARIRNMFAIAKDLAPCIIFIDEIDAVARKRGASISGGDTELTQTLNQLLSEMDGFEPQVNPIVVIGATNRADVLDHAILRPGRFDRKVEVTSPFINDRCKILNLHLQNVKQADALDVYKIARGTPGYSGAELAQLVNEAAILALREGKKEVTMFHIDQARDNINLGREVKGMNISYEESWKTAVHEAGHAIALVYQQYAEPLHKVTIVPRNGALGITFSMPKERYSTYVENLRAQIVFALGGSVAEELIYQGRGVGACSDLKQARRLATQIVMLYGLTEEFKDITFEEYINNQVHLPDELSTKLQSEVAKIIHECRQEAVTILTEHKDKLETLVSMLLEHGTVYGADVYKLCELAEPNIEYSLAN
ncbi:MAG: cell division protein FtsH [Epsilonproteobacteria bacterium]|nr:cell division protein FtsH [Campylobacterota bacterium]